jgi:hypothetical protein
LERHTVFKQSAFAVFAILIATVPANAASLFDTPGSNPATNRCDLYDPNCKPRQLFVRPPEPVTKNNPLGAPAPKLILPRDQNDRSANPSPLLHLPGTPNRRIYRALLCSEARRVIQYEGYRNIRTVKCGGKYHHFTAKRQGTKYLVNLKVRATTGKITVAGRSK